MIITGTSGKMLDVNDEQMVLVDAVKTEIELHHNIDHQQAYILDCSETPTGAADCFAVIQNTGPNPIVITEFVGQCAAAEVFYFNIGANGIPAGTTGVVLPVNRYAGSGNLADAVCNRGANITGLTGVTVEYLAVPAAAPSVTRRWEGGIVLPNGYEISVWATTGTNAILASLCFYVVTHPA